MRFSELLQFFPHLSVELRFDMLVRCLHRARVIWEESWHSFSPRQQKNSAVDDSDSSPELQQDDRHTTSPVKPRPMCMPSHIPMKRERNFVDEHGPFSSLPREDLPASSRQAGMAKGNWPVDELLILDLPSGGEGRGWAPLDQMLALVRGQGH